MTDLLLLRHGIAHERDFEAWPDDSERPLTPEGEERCHLIAGAIAEITPAPLRLISSPYDRAWRTAEIFHEVAGWPAPESFPALEPEISPEKTLAVLTASVNETNSNGDRASVAVVGHRPNLHEVASVALTGEEYMDIKIKKGGAVCIRFPGEIAPGAGQLRWLLTPKALLGTRLT